MERRERYDPEDLESLLHERGYNELLDEERAYVLRHLSGKEEYESMRALLLNLRRNEMDRPSISGDEAMRESVLRSFREQHRPQWRIWLNSLGALLEPPKSEGFNWRPALVVGSIALVIAAGVFVIQRAGMEGNVQVAELERKEAKERTAPPAERLAEPDADAVTRGSGEAEAPGSLSAGTLQLSEIQEDMEMEDMVESELKSTDAAMDDVNEEEILTDLKLNETEATSVDKERSASLSVDPSFSYTAAPVPVAVDELDRVRLERSSSQKQKASARELTATGSVLKKDGTVPAGISRTLAQDPELLELMAAGW